MAIRRHVKPIWLTLLLSACCIIRSHQLPAAAELNHKLVGVGHRVSRELEGDAREREWNELFAQNYKDLVDPEERSEEEEERDDGEQVFSGKLEVVEQWPVKELAVGQIGGLATDPEGYLHVFHRAGRSWTANSFDEKNLFVPKSDGPIKEPTLFTVNASNGILLNQWGENKFYLPHGLNIDSKGNLWMTDVAMHQVFKFEPNKHEPSLVLGKAFEPAKSESDTDRFCQPTDVAVASNGDFYVSDGYCASRVMKFDASGKFVQMFGLNDFQIPHSIVLIEDLDLICVADRENMRILCYNAGVKDASKLGEPEREYTDDSLGRVFAITYSKQDGVLYGVTGPTGVLSPQGFTIDMKDDDHYKTDIIAMWSPDDRGFDAPHDVAASPDGQSVFVSEITNGNPVWKFVKERE